MPPVAEAAHAEAGRPIMDEFVGEGESGQSPAVASSVCSRQVWRRVWTAPHRQELSYVDAALVGCGHVSGLLMRHGWPLALMLCADQVPIQTSHSKMS